MAASSAGPARALYYSRARASLVPQILGLAFIAFGALFIILSIVQQRIDFLLVPLITFPVGSLVAFMSVTVRVGEPERLVDLLARGSASGEAGAASA
ncbi:hypothetical protein [Arthrobacter sp. 18067]|uniref:hypothetical protein n=1 Tax=Arthrobacter sp. 18067 TaxID=2681413 RepID=UPI00135AC5A7|nr:hypothetical protein [Arthrobacter sp. 18067]